MRPRASAGDEIMRIEGLESQSLPPLFFSIFFSFFSNFFLNFSSCFFSFFNSLLSLFSFCSKPKKESISWTSSCGVHVGSWASETLERSNPIVDHEEMMTDSRSDESVGEMVKLRFDLRLEVVLFESRSVGFGSLWEAALPEKNDPSESLKTCYQEGGEIEGIEKEKKQSQRWSRAEREAESRLPRTTLRPKLTFSCSMNFSTLAVPQSMTVSLRPTRVSWESMDVDLLRE